MIIYKATNAVNGKVYIGKTVKKLEDRMYMHKWTAENSNDNYYFYNAINNYGWDAFTWEVIDTAESEDELNQKEVYWISKYNSNNRYNGYNMTDGGEGVTGLIHTDESRMKMAMASGAKPFYLYNIKGEFVGEYINQHECARELGLSVKTLNQLLKGQRLYTRKGYVGLYVEEFNEDILRNRLKEVSELIMAHGKGNAKLSRDDVIKIKQMLADGLTYSEINKAVPHLDKHVCSKIRTGEIWRDIIVEGFTSKPKTTRLTEEQIREIKYLLSKGHHTQIQLAKMFGVSRGTIIGIKTGRTYSHITIEEDKTLAI